MKNEKSKIKNNTIVVLYDGYVKNSKEKRLPIDVTSVMKAVQSVESALKNCGFNVVIMPFEYPFSEFAVNLRKTNPLLVFNLCETVGGNSKSEYIIPAILKALKINFTGSGATCLANCLDKVRTKELLQKENIPVPKYFVTQNAKFELPFDLSFPLIVKPSREDGSAGIFCDSVVSNQKDLIEKVKYIIEKFEQPALIEEFLQGREFNVSILDGEVMPISEIDFAGIEESTKRLVSYDAKWNSSTFEYNHTKPVCPAKVSAGFENEISDIALKTYRALNCKNYARVDTKTNSEGKLFVLEVNPNPDITSDSGFARSCKARGLSYDEMIKQIVSTSLSSAGIYTESIRKIRSGKRSKREKLENFCEASVSLHTPTRRDD